MRWVGKIIVLSIALLPCSPPAYAGRQIGNISYASADQQFAPSGVATILLNGASPSGKPSCASGPDQRWALELSGTKASTQVLYALALTAMSAGWKVTVTGTGACSTVSYLEDIAYIEVTR